MKERQFRSTGERSDRDATAKCRSTRISMCRSTEDASSASAIRTACRWSSGNPTGWPRALSRTSRIASDWTPGDFCMKRLLVLVVTALAVGVMPAAAQSKSSPVDAARRLSKDWKRATSGDLVAVGNTSEKTLREAVDEIVSFRAAFKTPLSKLAAGFPGVLPGRPVSEPDGAPAIRAARRARTPASVRERLLRKLSRSQRHRAWRRQHQTWCSTSSPTPSCRGTSTHCRCG